MAALSDEGKEKYSPPAIVVVVVVIVSINECTRRGTEIML